MENINSEEELLALVDALPNGKSFSKIAEKVTRNQRISDDEALFLFEKASLGLSATLANYIREKKHGDKTYFNRNFHIEPTNVCVFA